jgi:hypothetical protein
MTGMFYLLQMVDAHVDAHLKEFDLNPKLQVSIEPHDGKQFTDGTQHGYGFDL